MVGVIASILDVAVVGASLIGATTCLVFGIRETQQVTGAIVATRESVERLASEVASVDNSQPQVELHSGADPEQFSALAKVMQDLDPSGRFLIASMVFTAIAATSATLGLAINVISS
jgi:hypothetical protein